jgi:hypothetical protein
VAALVVPTAWLPKERLAFDKATGVVPVPLNFAVCGEFEALSLTVSVPVTEPVAVGVKVTEIWQFVPAPNVLGDNGQVDVCAKLPVVEIPAMVRGTVWLFCKVTIVAALVVPTAWLPNASDEADKVTGTVPVPLNCTV